MFTIKEPNALDKPWVLSRRHQEPPVVIPAEVAKLMKNYHVLPVEFLYHSLRKGRSGAILNQDDGMDLPFQIAAFFRAVLKLQSMVLVLVLCPDYLIADWHYNLSVHGNCDVILVQNCKHLESKLKRTGKNQALLLGLTELKLAEELVDLDLFSVVVQNLDEVANKRILRHLRGNFNIGLSNRSFYKHPDQKLQWTMLDWANPGCVGKLKDFYEHDNRNFAKYLDNYRIWWQRLTWSFCKSFKQPTEAERKMLQNEVRAWAKGHKLAPPPEHKPARKRKALTVIRAEPSPSKTPKAEENSHQPSTLPKSTDESSSDTVEYEPVPKGEVKLPSMDEHPILTSIVGNLEVSPEPVRSALLHTQPSCSRSSDFLSQFVESNATNLIQSNAAKPSNGAEPSIAAKPSTVTGSEAFLVDLAGSSVIERSDVIEPVSQPTDLNDEIDRIIAETAGLCDD